MIRFFSFFFFCAIFLFTFNLYTVQAESIDDLLNTIKGLYEKVEQLRTQIEKIQNGSVEKTKITIELSYGMTHTQVMYLQKILNTSSDTRVADSGAGSKGYETNFFGDRTLSALKLFQEKFKAERAKYSSDEITGVVDFGTMMVLNNLMEEETIDEQTPVKNTPQSSVSLLTKEVKLSRISPDSGGPNPTITLYGSGFSKTKNTIYTTFDTYSNIPSPDGETITLTLLSDIFPSVFGDKTMRSIAIHNGETKNLAPESLSFPIPVFVANEFGTSTAKIYMLSY